MDTRSSPRYLTKDDLRDCQRQAVPFLKRVKKAALWAEMGLGKSGATLTALSELIDELEVGRVLISAPLAVANKTWPDEFALWAQARHLEYKVVWGAEPGPKIHSRAGERRIRHWTAKVDELTQAIADAGEDDAKVREIRKELRRAKITLQWGLCVARHPERIHVINWHNLAWLVHFWGSAWPYDTVIIDEASIGLKNARNTLLWRALRKVMGHTERMIQLTGTPTPKGLMNLWGPIYLLDGGERLGRTITAFRERYFIKGFNQWDYKPKPGALEAALDRVADIVLVQRSGDYLDLPPEYELPYPVALSDEEMEIYIRMQNEYVAELEGVEIEAVNAGALRIKLLQLANGQIYDGDRIARTFHTRKLDAMEEYIERRQGENILCFYYFQHDLIAIQKKFPHAKLLRKGDPAMIDDWNAGKVELMLLHPASGGHGLNIQWGGRRALWYGPVNDLELTQQANKRLGGARSVGLGTTWIDYLVTTGTIDEHEMGCIKAKSESQEMTMEYLKGLLATIS